MYSIVGQFNKPTATTNTATQVQPKQPPPPPPARDPMATMVHGCAIGAFIILSLLWSVFIKPKIFPPKKE